MEITKASVFAVLGWAKAIGYLLSESIWIQVPIAKQGKRILQKIRRQPTPPKDYTDYTLTFCPENGGPSVRQRRFRTLETMILGWSMLVFGGVSVRPALMWRYPISCEFPTALFVK